MDWHQENQEPVGHEEDGTEEAVTMQTAEHAEDYANEEPEACQEQCYVLHEDPASYSEHHEDHADGEVQNVLSDGWQPQRPPEHPEEWYSYVEQHEDHESYTQVEQQGGQESYGDSDGGEEPSYDYHVDGGGCGYEAEDPCYDEYEGNEAWEHVNM